MGPDAIILVFWMLSFKPIFSLSSYTFIKKLFSSSSLSAIRVVSSASEVINISPSNLDSSLCFIQSRISHDVLYNKGLSSQGYGFSSGHVWMWELDYKESWALKKWCFWTVVLEKTLENSLECKEIQPVHSKVDQSWVFIGRTDVEDEPPILWPSDAKSWLIGKNPDAGKDWGQEEKGTTEDEMVGWYHRLDGYRFGWTPGVCDGQGGLACCSSWGCKESNSTERLNWTYTL